MIRTKGLDRLIRKYDGAPEVIRKEIKAVLVENTTKMAQHGRRDHRFTSRTGSAERSMVSEFEQGKGFQRATVKIDPTLVTTKSGYNYTWGLHDGTGSGYMRSPISPPVIPHVFKNGGGIKADHFLYRGVKRYEGRLKVGLEKVPQKVKRYFKR